ncbi:MAG: TolC family protein, partial [Emcibacter sp.]|nr:TolC family protein [Emcibacter sp.]
MRIQNWGVRYGMVACFLLNSLSLNAYGEVNGIEARTHLKSIISVYESVPAYTQVFKENIQAAVTNHPRTAAAIALRDSFRYRQREAEAGFYPTLDIGVSGRYRMFDSFEDRFDNITERSRRNRSANATLTGRTLLYDAGRTSSLVASAKHSFTAAHEEYGMTVSSIALTAIEIHFRVVFQRMRQKMHQNIIDDYRETLEKVRSRFDSGRGPGRDVVLLEARLALAEADFLLARRDLEETVIQYEENYGFPPANLKRPEIILSIPETLGDAMELGFLNSPSLSISNSMMMASKEDMVAEKAGLLPQLSMELAATKYDLDRGNGDYEVTARLVMNYNLYSGGVTKARISRTRAEYERARHEEAVAHRRVTREIKVSYQNIGFQDGRVCALKKATVASKR